MLRQAAVEAFVMRWRNGHRRGHPAVAQDPMTTAAAIDSLVHVHHSVILVEMTGPSIRGEEAEEARREQTGEKATTTTTTTTKPGHQSAENAGKEQTREKTTTTTKTGRSTEENDGEI